MSSTAQVEKRTPLYDSQVELAARFGDFYGWEMAHSYTDATEEHLRVRGGVGLIDLAFHGAIRVGGKEGAQFLHGLVTNDVKSLVRGKGMRAAFLTGHGKVRALSRILGFGDEYLIINDPQTHEKIFKYVFPFTYAGDFKAEDVTDDYRILSVQGPKSLLVMKEICFEPVPQLEAHSWVETIIAGHHVLVARADHSGDMGFDIFVQLAGLKDVWDFILLKGSFHSISLTGLQAMETLRIEAGRPVWGIDVDENNMMLESGLADAVSFTKGCYTGQEAVAMATYRGHVSKKISGLVIEGDRVPARGDKILKDGKETGHITSAIKSPSLGKVIALALLKYGFFDPGTTLEVTTIERTSQASVVELPFYKAT